MNKTLILQSETDKHLKSILGERGSLFMNQDDHEYTMQMIYEAKMIMEGLEDVQAGRIVDVEKVIADIREKYGI